MVPQSPHFGSASMLAMLARCHDISQGFLDRGNIRQGVTRPSRHKTILAHQSHLGYEGKRLWENQAHHFRDLCKVGANSGSGGK